MDNPKNNNKSWLIALCVAGILIATYFGMQRWFGQLDEKLVHYERFEVAPAFALPLQKHVAPAALTGKTQVTLQDLKGHTVLLHFWASWCVPCREEKPMLEELVNQYQDGSLTVIGISSYETAIALRDSGMLAEAPFTVLLDEEGETALAYKVRAIPQSVLVDGAGRVRYRVKGKLSPQEIDAIQNVLVSLREEEKKPSTAAVNL
ncbi:TlpA family protein disulfide reductase [Oligoflexus tunisiensis]|uniref:TlpA family protein disulfide reductase n=1 Tax=Oligoflexus tunisiensis TaxID=708132 RepID=UPI000B000158|nr:TlpA disulfide reductase family protein [Oligoflexus tunisiensis]